MCSWTNLLCLRGNYHDDDNDNSYFYYDNDDIHFDDIHFDNYHYYNYNNKLTHCSPLSRQFRQQWLLQRLC